MRSIERVAGSCMGLLFLTSITGCAADCVGVSVPGFNLVLVDATSKQPITDNVTATARSGDRSYPLELFTGVQPPTFSGVIREGVYQLHIEAEGYQSFVRDSMELRRTGRCQELERVYLTIPLQRRA